MWNYTFAYTAASLANLQPFASSLQNITVPKHQLPGSFKYVWFSNGLLWSSIWLYYTYSSNHLKVKNTLKNFKLSFFFKQ